MNIKLTPAQRHYLARCVAHEISGIQGANPEQADYEMVDRMILELSTMTVEVEN